MPYAAATPGSALQEWSSVGRQNGELPFNYRNLLPEGIDILYSPGKKYVRHEEVITVSAVGKMGARLGYQRSEQAGHTKDVFTGTLPLEAGEETWSQRWLNGRR